MRTLRARRDFPVWETVSVVALLGLWQAASNLNVVAGNALPSATSTFGRLGTLTMTSEFWSAIGQTMEIWALALALSVAVTVPVGLLIGYLPGAFTASKLVIDFMRSVPPVTLLPLLILLLGTTGEMKLVLIYFGISWPLLLQSVYGTAEVDPGAKHMVAVYQVRRWDRLRYLILPSAAPFIATGVRLAAVSGLLLTLTGEYIGAAPGIGLRMAAAETAGATPSLYAYVLVTAVIGMLVNAAFSILEKRVIFWRRSGTGDVA